MVELAPDCSLEICPNGRTRGCFGASPNHGMRVLKKAYLLGGLSPVEWSGTQGQYVHVGDLDGRPGCRPQRGTPSHPLPPCGGQAWEEWCRRRVGSAFPHCCRMARGHGLRLKDYTPFPPGEKRWCAAFKPVPELAAISLAFAKVERSLIPLQRLDR